MTNSELAKSYLLKATKRLKVLHLLKEEKAYSDVIREAQEVVELALKGMLREIGVEPPKWHDVGPLIIEFRKKFPREVANSHLICLSSNSILPMAMPKFRGSGVPNALRGFQVRLTLKRRMTSSPTSCATSYS